MGEKGRWAHPFTRDLNSSRRKRSSYISGRTKKDLGIFGDKVDNSSDGKAHLNHKISESSTFKHSDATAQCPQTPLLEQLCRPTSLPEFIRAAADRTQ